MTPKKPRKPYFISLDSAAALTAELKPPGVTRHAIAGHVRRGRLTPIWFGRKIMLRREEFEKWLRRKWL